MKMKMNTFLESMKNRNIIKQQVVFLGCRGVGKTEASLALVQYLISKNLSYCNVDGLSRSLTTLVNQAFGNAVFNPLESPEQEDSAEIFYREYSMITKILKREPRDVVIWNRLPIDVFFFTSLSSWKSSGDLSSQGLSEIKFTNLTSEILDLEVESPTLIFLLKAPKRGSGLDLSSLYESYMKHYFQELKSKQSFRFDFYEIDWHPEGCDKKSKICLDLVRERIG